MSIGTPSFGTFNTFGSGSTGLSTGSFSTGATNFTAAAPFKFNVGTSL